MTGPASRRAGAPFTALAILLGGWALVRAALWQSPFPESLPDLGIPGFVPPVLATAPAGPPAPENTFAADRVIDTPHFEPMLQTRLDPAPFEAGPWMQPPPSDTAVGFNKPATGPGNWSAAEDSRTRLTAHHQILYAAGFAYAPTATQFRHLVAERKARATTAAGEGSVMIAAAGFPLAPSKPDLRRWSLDSWALWRSGSGRGFAAATSLPSYGASQAGAVLRYRIGAAGDSGSPHRPAAYVRATRALVADAEAEIAAGLSARPMSGLPLRAHAEVRATHLPTSTEIRPAAFATTELVPQDLPMGFKANLYAQGGYVGGQFATAFADGQLRIDRELAQFDLGIVQVGAGAWGGAQKGAARLDVGPSASLTLDHGPLPARLSVDYRVRVAGDAQPGSGVAVTLTTGF